MFRTAIRTRFFRNLSTYKNLIYEKLPGVGEGISVVALNRPQQKNAFSRELVEELYEVIQRIRDSSARVVIIRSNVPGVFCAGADLKERASMRESDVGPFVRKLRYMVALVSDLPIPVIAAIDGAALGGGLELALGCDLRIASEDAKLGLVETKLAIIPGAGGTQRLARLINPAVAKELIYTGRIITGKESFEIGMVNHAVQQNNDKTAAFVKAKEIAEEIASAGPVAVRMAKVAITKGLESDISTGLAIEEACYAQVIPTKDRTEGLKAFQEKRKPTYTGE